MNKLIEEPLDSPKCRGSRLAILRILCGSVTAAEFCGDGDSKLNTHTFVGWENGRFNGISKLGAQRVIKRARDFQVICPHDWLWYGLGPLPACDLSIDKNNVESKTVIDEFMPIFNDINVVQTVITDDAMAPEYATGDMIAGIKQHSAKNCFGLDCIVQLEEGEILARNVDRSDRPHRVTLRHHNHNTQLKTLFDVKIIMVAPIIFRYRKLDKLIKP